MNVWHFVFEQIARCQSFSCNPGFALCKMCHQDPAAILEPSIGGVTVLKKEEPQGMCSHCQHLWLKDFGPGDQQPGFMPGEGHGFFYPALLWSCAGGLWGQPGPLLITMVVLTSVNKELISCAAGLRTAVRWHYNWCGPDSRSLLTCNLPGHIVSSAICTVVDFLTPGSPLKSTV